MRSSISLFAPTIFVTAVKNILPKFKFNWRITNKKATLAGDLSLFLKLQMRLSEATIVVTILNPVPQFYLLRMSKCTE